MMFQITDVVVLGTQCLLVMAHHWAGTPRLSLASCAEEWGTAWGSYSQTTTKTPRPMQAFMTKRTPHKSAALSPGTSNWEPQEIPIYWV